MGGKPRSGGEQSIGDLWSAVRTARDALRAERHALKNARRTQEAQFEYLAALEAYVHAVNDAREVVHYQLRNEMALYRSFLYPRDP